MKALIVFIIGVTMLISCSYYMNDKWGKKPSTHTDWAVAGILIGFIISNLIIVITISRIPKKNRR